MTNKRVIIVLSVLAVVAILLLVSSLVFKVKTIDVVVLNSNTETNFVKSEEVINSSELKIGQNIFFVGKNKATQKIEKALPYVKVENIVSKFPNKLVINISERVEEFYVTYETDANKFYLILDNELKILKVVEQKEDVDSDLCEFKFKPSSCEVATKLDNFEVLSLINNFESFTLDASKVKQYISMCEFVGEDFVIHTKLSTTITVRKYKDDQKRKMQEAISKFLTAGGGIYNGDIIV